MTYRLDLALANRALAVALAAGTYAFVPSPSHARQAPPPVMAERAPVTQLIVKVARPHRRAEARVPRSAEAGEDKAVAILERAFVRAAHAFSDTQRDAAEGTVHRARRSVPAMTFARAMSGDAHVVGLDAPLASEAAAALAQRLSADPDIAYAVPDERWFAFAAPTDPQFGSQWGLGSEPGAANFVPAWDVSTGASGIVTAVVDSGLRPHADLAANVLPGYDFVTDATAANDGDGRDPDASDPGDWRMASDPPLCNPTGNPVDSSWHGTHVAGIIGAVANNGIGGVGGNWHGRILPVRVLGRCGAQMSDILDAVRWSAGLPVPNVPENRHRARIINLSIGNAMPCSLPTQEAIDDVRHAGATVVAAAGNDAGPANQPASCDGVIAVAALKRDGNRVDYSSLGPRIDLGAPGDGIVSTYNAGTRTPAADSYLERSGTSAAAPHVAAAIGLMLAVDATLTPDSIAKFLRESARPYPAASDCVPVAGYTECGTGMLDAARAVAAVAAARAAKAGTVPPLAD
jgi:serine protease